MACWRRPSGGGGEKRTGASVFGVSFFLFFSLLSFRGDGVGAWWPGAEEAHSLARRRGAGLLGCLREESCQLDLHVACLLEGEGSEAGEGSSSSRQVD